MAGNEVIDRLRSLIGRDIAVAIATVDSIAEHAAWGFVAEVTIQPDGIGPFECRVVWGGSRNGGGDFFPVATGDEVVVLFPGGDPHRAVAIAGLSSSPSPVPSSWDNQQPQHVHPRGKLFLLSGAGVAQAVVLESLLGKLKSVMDEILVINAAIPSGVSALPAATPTIIELQATLATGFRSTALKTE